MKISTPGKSVSGRNNSLQSGMTLIELMVAMAIVGLIFAVAAAGLSSVLNISLKSDAGHLGSIIRNLSNKAITDHLYIRLAYDISAQTYHVEQSDEPFLVSIEEPSSKSTKEDAEKTDESDEKEEAKKTPEELATIEEGPLKPAHLSSGVFFKDIAVSYSSQKITEGVAYTYFFPDGFSTQTLINLRDEDDEEVYSIEVSPVSGNVKIESAYREMEKE